MRTKKRNMVMEILVCTVLVSVVFLGYMCFAKDNSSMKIRDISGDRTVMNAFAFNGIAGDESGYHHFTWNEGELKTKYYPANAQGMDALLTAEKEGDTFGKYFAEYRYSLSNVDAETTPVPVNDVKKKSISGIDELSESILYKSIGIALLIYISFHKLTVNVIEEIQNIFCCQKGLVINCNSAEEICVYYLGKVNIHFLFNEFYDTAFLFDFFNVAVKEVLYEEEKIFRNVSLSSVLL